MHILLFHDSKLPPLHYGGIERIVVALAEEYSRRGHRVSVLCKKGSAIEGANCVELPDGGAEDIEKVIPQDVDFIHSHQPLVVEPKRPYLVTIHGNGHPGEKYFANTNFLSRSHAANHGSKIFVFNGVDLKRFPFVEKKEDYFLFLARTTWRVKNLKTAIAWANDLKLHLKIIGGRGISRGNIEYLGFVDDQKKNEVLGKARALIYPTNWDEPCAGAPLESLACGTPVISSVNGCMPEMVDEKTGVLCRNYRELLEAPSKLERVLPSECRKRAERDFSVERMAEDYLLLMNQIIQKGRLVSERELPRYSFKKENVIFLYKPTLANRVRLELTGKV